MPNGRDFVDWDSYNEHLDDAKKGFSALEKVNSELFGDVQAGRKSLRQEFIEEITKNRRQTRWLIMSLSITIAIYTVAMWLLGYHKFP